MLVKTSFASGRNAAALFFLFFLISCNSNTYQSGERVYKLTCANCHLDQGEGLGLLIPPLAGSDYLLANRERLPCIVRYGLSDSIVVKGKLYGEKMEGLSNLSDIQITNVLNYVQSKWGDPNRVYNLDEVRKLLKSCNTLPTQDTRTPQ